MLSLRWWVTVLVWADFGRTESFKPFSSEVIKPVKVKSRSVTPMDLRSSHPYGIYVLFLILHQPVRPTLLDVLLYFGAGLDHPNLRGDERATLWHGCSHLSSRLSKRPPLVARRRLVSLWTDRWDAQLGIQRVWTAHADLPRNDGTAIGQRQQGYPSSPQSRHRDRLEVGAVMQEGSHGAILSLN